jgi:hypothetical protein
VGRLEGASPGSIVECHLSQVSGRGPLE